MPAVTIGVPAYNASATIGETVGSLLRQTFEDVEVIVGDNASTDHTVELLHDLFPRERRLRIVRHPQNIGANSNYSSLVAQASGGYFKWASSSDWCAPTFIESCIVALEAVPQIVLACPRTKTFEHDVTNAVDYVGDIGVEHDDPVQRFIALLQELRLNNAINGVFRTEVLRRTRLIEHYPGSDVVMMAHIALLGRIRLLPDSLYYRRMTRETATSLQTPEQRLRHHYPVRTARSLFPNWRWYGALVYAVVSSGLSWQQVVHALRFTGKMARWSRRELLADFAVAARFPFGVDG